MQRILVIDDEAEIRRVIAKHLKRHGYDVTAIGTGNEGLDAAADNPPDVIILDLRLPDIDGLTVCSQLRVWSKAPIIIISGCHDEMTKVAALEQGADDYLCKPFSMEELRVRIRVALRRSIPSSQTSVIRCADLHIDLARRYVSVNDRAIHLTPTEYKLLITLANHPGMVMTHELLIEKVWGPSYAGNIQNLHVFISQLRRKIEPCPKTPVYILTESGVGYHFALAHEQGA